MAIKTFKNGIKVLDKDGPQINAKIGVKCIILC